MNKLDIFTRNIVGDFNNDKQVNEELKNGKQVHPRAQHINRVCNHKFIHLPDGFDKFFLLEESFYEKPDGTKTTMPHLFLLSLNENDHVVLTAYELPKIDKKLIQNSNNALLFDYTELELSKNTSPMVYDFSEEKVFSCDATSILPNGLTFRIVEEIGEDTLSVFEMMIKDGKNLLGIDSPIIFNRV